MKKQPKDRHLDTPAEANRDKHINYTALENNETDPANEKASGKLTQEKTEQEISSGKGKDKDVHPRLTDNPRHFTDEASPMADSPED